MVLFSHKWQPKRTLLSLLMLPLLVNLVQGQANITAAQEDMRVMAEGLEFAALDTTIYVSLENLNDVSASNTHIPYDSILDMGGVYTVFPETGTFSATRRILVRQVNPWRGSYVNFPRGTQTATEPYDQGSPIDPWGNPYYLFNPLGLLRGDEGIITQELYGDSFGRYTIVSLGQDGEMSGDDLARQFGADLEGTRLSSLKGPGVTLTSPPDQAPPTYSVVAGTTVTLRGINYGAPAEHKHVMFGPHVVDEVLSWTSREVTVRIPETFSGTDSFTLHIGGNSTNALSATIVGSDTSVTNWQNY